MPNITTKQIFMYTACCNIWKLQEWLIINLYTLVQILSVPQPSENYFVRILFWKTEKCDDILSYLSSNPLNLTFSPNRMILSSILKYERMLAYKYPIYIIIFTVYIGWAWYRHMSISYIYPLYLYYISSIS